MQMRGEFFSVSISKVTDLQLEADEHDQEDKADAEDANGQTDQPPEQTPPPRRVVVFLTSRYGTAALHPLQRVKRQQRNGVKKIN